MDKLRLVLVGIEGAVNLGMIARLCENFQVDELYIVSPKADFEEAREYAVRAAHRLDEAVVVGSLDEALRGSSLSLCTSAKASHRDALRVPLHPKRAAEIAARTEGVVALVMGRESVGLTREELEQCDLLVNIPTSPRYQALNLANATAILLYEFFQARLEPVSRKHESKYVRLIEKYVEELASILVTDPRRRKEVIVSIRRLAARNIEYEKDLRSLLYLLSRACNLIEGCGSEAATEM
ncbi:MAG: RNA methyltransferase [Desulfurococcales archaeon]|nr:RNA methyltransferase [Desulfurococcales archaeon]MCE4627015.1 RNA methyltransferase [Desulfurococcales archaeon]MCE4628687.1 RNA methyltransferase [Desulfurococcales archaeon]